MRFSSRLIVRIVLPLLALVALVSASAMSGAFRRSSSQAASSSSDAGFYQQTNLVSDILRVARFTDPNLVNAWGLSP